MSTTDQVQTRSSAKFDGVRASHGRRRAVRAPAARGRPVSKATAAAGRAIFTLILIVAALVFLFLAVGPRFLNYQTSTMLTGSMSPGINPGDVVVSVRTPVSELKVGDVITYSIPIDDHRIETHRVARIKRDDAGTTSVTTKGDANAGADPWTAVLSEDYVYTQAGVVPYLGDVIRALRQPLIQSVFLYGASALLVVVVLTAIWRKPRESVSGALAELTADDDPGVGPEKLRS
ncbi:signal peptidase I [Arthrobacter sp. YAF34]|uniref:signal peptidase I n=1 Tax=Arthrobacter sp. YAF34 TaxID=3233083 RepID=UPI003F919317